MLSIKSKEMIALGIITAIQAVAAYVAEQSKNALQSSGRSRKKTKARKSPVYTSKRHRRGSRSRSKNKKFKVAVGSRN